MQKPLNLYAIEAICKNGEKALCFKQKNNLYFVLTSRKNKKYKTPPPPSFFNSKKEAKLAIENTINVKNSTLKNKFSEVVECLKTRIVKTEIHF